MHSHSIKDSEEDFFITNKALCALLFENKEEIQFKDLMDLKAEFKEDLWHYEFHTYEPDEKTGQITVQAFLKSLTVCLPSRRL